METYCPLKPSEWQNLQLVLDLERRTVSGHVRSGSDVVSFVDKPFASPSKVSNVIDFVGLEGDAKADTKLPVLEIDNLRFQQSPFAPVETAPFPTTLDVAAMTDQLKQLTGQDGDLELQLDGTPPGVPWSPGPNSVVKISTGSQSPFQNLFPPGSLGIHLPNRGEYDGYQQAFATTWKGETTERLVVSFDFRCASDTAGGAGSWRFYLGHGPGVSAAVELFINGSEFTRRSGDARDVVSPLRIGQWYQVQLTLNLRERTYSGVIASPMERTEFSGAFATGWDGILDLTFIDAYGHRPGVRPALDTDNFAISETSLAPFGSTTLSLAPSDLERRARALELRKTLADFSREVESARKDLQALLEAGPCEMAYGVVEGTAHNARIQVRGEPDQPGAEVPRGLIKVLGGGTLPADTQGSGRLELARWITQPDNPLTARVMANRIWQYHFGRGLVKTSNDFGVRGQRPSHPELLDHLAGEFVRSGWSVKSMHRLIMLSSTYQQSSLLTDASAAATSEIVASEKLASFPRRRLSAEEIRDSILAVSGELDSTPGREHPFPSSVTWGFSQHGPFNAVYDHNQRSIYLMTQRIKRHPFLGLFDGADPNTTTAERAATIVPTQALFFLNDPFVHAKAEKCAERIRAVVADEPGQIDRAKRLVTGRWPTAVEREDAAKFLQTYRTELAAAGQDHLETRTLAAYVRTLFCGNEFLHVD